MGGLIKNAPQDTGVVKNLRLKELEPSGNHEGLDTSQACSYKTCKSTP